MFLLEVYRVDSFGRTLFKRRISDNECKLADWVIDHAQKWSFYAVDILPYPNCDGAVFIRGDKTPIFEFTITKIAMV